jgi:hypothetical protein
LQRLWPSLCETNAKIGIEAGTKPGLFTSPNLDGRGFAEVMMAVMGKGRDKDDRDEHDSPTRSYSQVQMLSEGHCGVSNGARTLVGSKSCIWLFPAFLTFIIHYRASAASHMAHIRLERASLVSRLFYGHIQTNQSIFTARAMHSMACFNSTITNSNTATPIATRRLAQNPGLLRRRDVGGGGGLFGGKRQISVFYGRFCDRTGWNEIGRTGRGE